MILMEKIHAERIARVRAALESCGLTQMIVCDPKSVWYLTGVAVSTVTGMTQFSSRMMQKISTSTSARFSSSQPGWKSTSSRPRVE